MPTFMPMNRRAMRLALAVALCACSDALVEEPKSFVTTETFYKTQADLQSGVLAIYAQLRTALGFGATSFYGLDNASDQGMPDPQETNATVVAQARVDYSGSSTNNTEGSWAPGFLLIYRANLVIDQAANVSMDATTKAQWIAEAKFLRAFTYLRLSKLYSAAGTDNADDVPLLLTTADHANPSVARAKTSEVHAQIVKDLTEAEATLPAAWTGANAGRVTKGAAQMALADLYVWRSSFLKTNEWQKASDWAKKVVDNAAYGLNDNYFATFLPTNRGNKEMIFRIVASPDSRGSTAAVNTYFPRILGFSPQGGGFGVSQPTDWLVSSYAAGDYRGNSGSQSDTVGFRTFGCSASASIGCKTFRPHVWKYRPSSIDNSLGDVDIALYRYAEALLFYAEAQNELGNTAEAIRAANLVRARARKGTGAQTRAQPADLTSLSQAGMRDAIYNERNWELDFESKRWFDLVRRDALEPGYFVAQLAAHDPFAVSGGKISAAKMRFPIPQSQIDIDPALKQNPGY
jgi:hypothetical protein